MNVHLLGTKAPSLSEYLGGKWLPVTDITNMNDRKLTRLVGIPGGKHRCTKHGQMTRRLSYSSCAYVLYTFLSVPQQMCKDPKVFIKTSLATICFTAVFLLHSFLISLCATHCRNFQSCIFMKMIKKPT